MTGLLSAAPAWVSYVDDDDNNTWNNSEPLYSDEDGNAKVSKNDRRITGVFAERRLLKKAGAIDSLGGTYVDTAAMAAPKWYSETNPWTEGSDIVIDHDGDELYNVDTLNRMIIQNEGTAVSGDIDRIELWMEDNGLGGFQDIYSNQPTDLLLGSFTYDIAQSKWRIANLLQPLIASERFYVTVNVNAKATNQSTMQFALSTNGTITTHRTMPDTLSVNNNTQTISADAVLPPSQQIPPAGVSAQNSIVRIIDHISVPADGTSVATIEIEVRNTNNERMANQTVRLERLRASENVVLSVEQKTTNVLGIASFPENSLEAGVFRFRGRAGSLLIGNAVVTYTPVFDPNDVPPGPSSLVAGDLFMNKDTGAGGTVYYYANGKKYPFPNERVYLSWYPNFESVIIKKITAVEIGAIPWGTNVRYRPGTRMVKVPDDPKVYAVTPGGTVCWVKDEESAKKIYGETWNKKIDDLLASLFVSTYHQDPACDLSINSPYPSGTLVSFNDKPYYIDNGNARIIPGDAWSGNRFRAEFLISIVNLNGYALGAAVGNTEFSHAVN